MTGGRNPSGEGSVYQRHSDGLWVASVTVSGRRKVRYAKTEKQALKKRRDLLAEKEAGRPLPPGRTPTLGQYLQHWLDVRLPSDVEAGHIRRGTADSYRTKIRVHVLPTDLAAVRLDELVPDDFRSWQRLKLRSTSARGKRLAPRTVGYTHAIIRRALNDAVRDNALGRNVAALVPLPAGQDDGIEPFDEDELQAVLVEAIADRHRVLWLTLLALGLRKGEALALRWSCIDFDAATVAVKKQIYRERDDEPDPETGRYGGRLVEADTKTSDSKAKLIMPAALVEVLREHKAAQEERQKATRVWIDPDLVFATRVGTAIEPRNVNRAWATVCERAGVHLRVHDLRHAAASLAFAEGATIKAVQEMLRHSREATTSNIYVHVLESARRATADTMDGVIRKIGTK